MYICTVCFVFPVLYELLDDFLFPVKYEYAALQKGVKKILIILCRCNQHRYSERKPKLKVIPCYLQKCVTAMGNGTHSSGTVKKTNILYIIPEDRHTHILLKNVKTGI